MARGRRTSDEVRAAVIAELLKGESLRTAAENTGVPLKTVARIRQEMTRLATPIMDSTEDDRKERAKRIGKLVLDSLEANYNAQRAIADVAAEVNYARGQTAEGLAVLFDRLADRATRILSIVAEADGAE
jgi:hypothetical protein